MWKTNGVDFSTQSNIRAIANSPTAHIFRVSVFQTNKKLKPNTYAFPPFSLFGLNVFQEHIVKLIVLNYFKS